MKLKPHFQMECSRVVQERRAPLESESLLENERNVPSASLIDVGPTNM